MDVFNKILCKENIKLEPKYITKAFKNEIHTRLKLKVEGICTKHGYIKHQSVEVYKIAPGIVELISLAGHVVYSVYFYADVCNPVIGSIVNAVISNINRFGILADAGYTLSGDYIPVLEIIIAKNSVNIQSDIDLELLKIGDELRIEIIGKKFELGEKKISGIGRVVKDITKNNMKKTIIEQTENEDAEEEVYDVNPNEEEEELDESVDDNLEEEEDEEETKGGGEGGSEFFSDEENFFSEEDNADPDDDTNDDKASSSESEINDEY